MLFLNGIPVATAELKTDFTQRIGDVIGQYRFERVPRRRGQAAEPLLTLPSGALVHFAVSNREVAMVTKRDGPATEFPPFNQGDHGAAGNPANPAGGHRTAYLWEQVRARESWREILARYLIAKRGKKKQAERFIFPRFHHLDVTRKLQAAVFDFERTRGVVATITNKDGRKSGKQAEALDGSKKIVVCTIGGGGQNEVCLSQSPYFLITRSLRGFRQRKIRTDDSINFTPAKSYALQQTP